MDDERKLGRRDALRVGAAAGLGLGLAGCTAPGNQPLFEESFEAGLDRWETASYIGPEEEQESFESEIQRSQEHAFAGDWSLEVFTEGDHDDGTAWITTALSPGDVDEFEVSFSAWSQSESFNILRNVVAYLGPEAPTVEEDFPAPGANSTVVPDAPYGGLREPLHLAEGWREYSFEWAPETVPETLYLSLGVSVVWESDATHYLDAVTVEER